MVFEKPEVKDKTGWGAQWHTTSHDAGMAYTADHPMLHAGPCMPGLPDVFWGIKPKPAIKKAKKKQMLKFNRKPRKY